MSGDFRIKNGREISMRDFFRGGHVNIESFLGISIKLTQSLGEIHNKGILHRNLTPDNIFVNLDQMEVKITDFSIAIPYLLMVK